MRRSHSGDGLRDRLLARLKSRIVLGGIGLRRVIDEGDAPCPVGTLTLVVPYPLAATPLSRPERRIGCVLRQGSPEPKPPSPTSTLTDPSRCSPSLCFAPRPQNCRRILA